MTDQADLPVAAILRARKANLGDTLAQFIVRELKDTFDTEANDAEQLAEAAKAAKAVENAASELAAVAAALRAGTRCVAGAGISTRPSLRRTRAC